MHIKMYTKGYCGYCYAAKNLLVKRGLDFEEVSVSSDIQAEKIMRELSGRTSVPQIFIDNKPIGGYTELVELDMEGAL
jgi:glutaredoxin 3